MAQRKTRQKLHELEQAFQMPASEILDVVLENNRCLMNIKGAIAQEHLARHLKKLKKRGLIKDFKQIDTDGQPDFELQCRGRSFKMECKNVQKESKGKNKSITIDFWKTRYQKTQGPISRFYRESEFEILAACLFNRTNEWKFVFVQTSVLPRHPDDPQRFSNRVSLDRGTLYGAHWTGNLKAVLDQLV